VFCDRDDGEKEEDDNDAAEDGEEVEMGVPPLLLRLRVVEAAPELEANGQQARVGEGGEHGGSVCEMGKGANEVRKCNGQHPSLFSGLAGQNLASALCRHCEIMTVGVSQKSECFPPP